MKSSIKNPVAKNFNKFCKPSVVPNKKEKLANEAEMEYVKNEIIYLENGDWMIFDEMKDIGCSSISVED